LGIRGDREKGEWVKVGKPYIRQVEVIGLVEKLGTVILFDDIEDLLKWSGAGVGTDWTVAKSTAMAFNGSASLYIQTKATTPAAGDYAWAYRNIYLPGAKKMSLELFWRLTSATLMGEIEYRLFYYDSAMRHEAKLIYLPPEEKWQYQDSAGSRQDIPGGAQKLHHDTWHRAKMIVDFEKDEYVILISDALVLDLSGLTLKTVADTTGQVLQIGLLVRTKTAAQADIYFDDIFVKEE